MHLSLSACLTALRAWRRVLLALGTLLLLYAGLGFLVLPRVLEAKLPPRLSALLGRPVTVRKIRTNPFALSVSLEGLRIQERDGSAFLGWERLYVNVQASSAFTRTLRFAAIELDRPFGRLVVLKDGRLNVSDIVERLSGPAEPKPAQEAPARAVAIGLLRIAGARLDLEDRGPAQPFATTLGPVSFELRDFRTVQDSRSPYALEGVTERGERFAWKGSFALAPLRSEGSLRLERLALAKYAPYYREQVAFELREGLLDASANYTFAWGEGRHELRLGGGSLDLAGLRLGEAGREAVPLELPSLALRGLEADLLAPSLHIASLRLRGGHAALRREANGSLDLVQLLTPKPRPKDPDAKPLALAVDELGVEGFALDFEDHSTPRPVQARVENLSLALMGFSLDPKRAAEARLDLRLNGAPLHAEGKLWALRPAAELAVKLEGLELSPFDPYLAPALDVRVNRGRASLEGRLELPSLDAPRFQGRLELAGFEAMDGVGREPFLRYRAFRLAGIDLALAARTLRIRQVELLEPESRLVIAADGSTNVNRALKLGPAPAGAAGKALPPTPERPFQLAIGDIRLKGGRLGFIDRSLEPNAALVITDLEGSYTGLSSAPESVSRVELSGKAGGLAPLSIRGHAMPLRSDADTDVALRITGADLSDFGPYAGKHLGYTIRKGKLDVEARVAIQRRKLDALFKTRLDQFYLGDRTGSPDATRLPVKLALAVLRDRKGVIDLELPVEGSLDDPDFRYGRIVWKAILNVLGKVAASPFTLLGKLVGSGERDLSCAAFEPGLSALNPELEGKLQALAKALAERPDLGLEVEGTADPVADLSALRRQALERRLRELKAQAAQQDPGQVQVTPSEREAWLKAAYAAAFPAPKPAKGHSPTPPPPAAEMEQRLLGSLQIPASELRQLADARTKAVLAALRQAQVDPARVFEVEGGARAKKEGGAKVYFGLR